MPVRTRLIPTLALASLSLGFAPAAYAATQRVTAFPGEVIDGPSSDIVRVGNLDVARDGTGAVTYVKRDGGVEHVFVSRLIDGVWQTPERVDGAVGDAGGEPAVAVGDGGKVLVAWTAGGSVFTSVRAAANGSFGAPQSVGSSGGARAFPSIDLGSNDVAYVVWSASGDVRAARLDRGATSFAGLAAPLDSSPAAAAGDSADRAPDVAVAADGVGLAVWGEKGADGAGHVIARKLFGLNVSQAPQTLDVAGFQNAPAAGAGADQPAVDIEDDSSFGWVVFRQAFADNGSTVTRALARRQRGTAFDDPVSIDGLAFPGAGDGVVAPAIDLSGRGDGLAAAGRAASGQVFGASLKFDEFLAPARLDSTGSGAPVAPVVAQSDNGDGLSAFVTGSAAPAVPPVASVLGGGARADAPAPTLDGVLRVRPYDDNVAQPEVVASAPALGPVDQFAGFAGGVDRTDDGAVVAIQGTGGDRRLVAAMFDRAPAGFVGNSSESFRKTAAPDLRWSVSRDLWGGCAYTVTVDDKVVGQTREEHLQVKTPIPDGVHRWRVACADRRGQSTAAPTRLLRIDSNPPAVSFTVSGTRRVGRSVRITAKASDAGGSGVKFVRIDAGDGSPVVATRSLVHVFGRRGTFIVRVSATDAAGNAVAATRRVKIAKAAKGK